MRPFLLLATLIIEAAFASADAARYVVRGGDTLSSIARRSGTTVSRLISLNGLPSSTIRPGQVLEVGGAGSATSARNAPVYQRGIASYYFGRRDCCTPYVAAHRSLPFGTWVRVTNLNNGRSVLVKINDRGPFVRGRVIDISNEAAAVLRISRLGLAPVAVSVVSRP